MSDEHPKGYVTLRFGVPVWLWLEVAQKARSNEVTPAEYCREVLLAAVPHNDGRPRLRTVVSGRLLRRLDAVASSAGIGIGEWVRCALESAVVEAERE